MKQDFRDAESVSPVVIGRITGFAFGIPERLPVKTGTVNPVDAGERNFSECHLPAMSVDEGDRCVVGMVEGYAVAVTCRPVAVCHAGSAALSGETCFRAVHGPGGFQNLTQFDPGFQLRIQAGPENIDRAALAVDRLVRDPALREEVLASQDRRLQDFQYPVIRDQLLQILRDFINN